MWAIAESGLPKGGSPAEHGHPRSCLAACSIMLQAMPNNLVFALALGIGIIAGLRSLTAPAAVSWAACLGWLDLQGSPLAFMGSKIAVAIFSLLAIAEYVADLLPSTP